MKTHYKYIHFREIPNPGKKTTRWECFNTNSNWPLGEVEWYGAWRQYIFETSGEIILNKGCLDDISDFLDQLNKLQRGKWKSKDGSKNEKK